MRSLHWSLAFLLPPLIYAQDNLPGMLTQCHDPGLFALTFDDGPSDYTPELLRTLDQERIPVTFFVLGEQADNRTLTPFLKDAYSRGHQIASHTYNHAHLNTLSAADIRDQMQRTDTAIRNAIGVSPSYMRPPYGECNAATQKVLQDMGYLIVQWNLDSNDWRYADQGAQMQAMVTENFLKELNKDDNTQAHSVSNTATTASTIVSSPPPPIRPASPNPKLQARDVAVASPSSSTLPSYISLQHDIQPFSVHQTPAIIKAIKEKNYRFVTIAECAGPMRRPMYSNAPDNVFQTNSTVGTTTPPSVTGATSGAHVHNAALSVSASVTRWPLITIGFLIYTTALL